MVAFLDALQALDERLLQMAVRTPPGLLTFFLVITTIGGGWGLLALVPFAVRRKTRDLTLWLFAAATVTSGFVSLLKALVGRSRPCDALPWCAAVAVGSPGGHSFPSGHAAGAFTFATFVAIRAPRLAPLVYPFAALVAFSRCVLGVHYPSDVLAGALLGTALGAVMARLSRRAPGEARER